MGRRDLEHANTLLMPGAPPSAGVAPQARAPLATDVLPDDLDEPVSFRSLVPLSTTVPMPEAEPREALGKVLFEERYLDRGLLGEGGMGEVRQARDVVVGREVAVKTMRRELESVARERFLHEARVQGQLEHPAVVPIYDLGLTADRRLFFTMKCVRGESLEALVAKLANRDKSTVERYPPRKLLAAFGQLALAVEYAHRRGVVHRDLKPANVMLGDFGELYVLDWGLARVPNAPEVAVAVSAPTLAGERGATLDGSVLGTPGYMAPEQVSGAIGRIDARADVYALGAILYELLALEPLHGQATNEAVMQATLTGPTPPLGNRPSSAHIPPELLALVGKATALRPEDRPASARDLATAIDAYLDGQRDEERRRELADEHLTRAEVHARSSDTRVEALRDVGRALALDPTNPRALSLLGELFSKLPDEVPQEAEPELAAVAEERRRGLLHVAWSRAVAWTIAAPAFVALGVRSVPRVLVVCGLVLANLAVATWLRRRVRASERSLKVSLGVSTACVASFSFFYGPLVLVPVYAVTNALTYALGGGRVLRWTAIGWSMMTLAAPLLASLVGLEVPYYGQHGAGGILIESPALATPLAPTTALLFVAFVATTITPTLLIGRLTDRLDEAERKVALQAFHLRQLLPPR